MSTAKQTPKNQPDSMTLQDIERATNSQHAATTQEPIDVSRNHSNEVKSDTVDERITPPPDFFATKSASNSQPNSQEIDMIKLQSSHKLGKDEKLSGQFGTPPLLSRYLRFAVKGVMLLGLIGLVVYIFQATKAGEKLQKLPGVSQVVEYISPQTLDRGTYTIAIPKEWNAHESVLREHLPEVREISQYEPVGQTGSIYSGLYTATNQTGEASVGVALSYITNAEFQKQFPDKGVFVLDTSGARVNDLFRVELTQSMNYSDERPNQYVVIAFTDPSTGENKKLFVSAVHAKENLTVVAWGIYNEPDWQSFWASKALEVVGKITIK